MPEGFLIDHDGHPTTDPRVMFQDGPGVPGEGAKLGALLPAGQHKGGGLSVMCELLGAVLSGGNSIAPHHPRGSGIILNSMTTLIVDPAAAVGAAGVEAMKEEAQRVCEYVRASPPRPGGNGDPVALPGDVERATEAARTRGGVPLSQGTWNDLVAVGKELGLPESLFDEALEQA